jgi:asparagine synthase (glutamine-hydrolysing)
MLRTQPARLREFIDTCDLPPEVLGEFWLWEMAEAASKDGVPVMLHGEGADELFFGYDFHWNVLSERQRVQSEPDSDLDSSPFDSGVPMALRSSAPRWEDRDAIADLMFWGGGVHPRFEYQRDNYFNPERLPGPLQDTPGLDTSRYSPVSTDSDVLGFVRACYDMSRSVNSNADYRHRMQFLEFVHKLPEVLLRRSEPSCMKHSVEMRLPFLDEDMVSLAVNLPLASLRTPELVKYPLRLAMKGMIPERIRKRPKEFFGVSFLEASQKWPSENPWFRDYLLESRFTSLGLVSKKYLESQYERLTRDNVGFETFLWKHVFTAVWYDNFISKVTQ